MIAERSNARSMRSFGASDRSRLPRGLHAAVDALVCQQMDGRLLNTIQRCCRSSRDFTPPPRA